MNESSKVYASLELDLIERATRLNWSAIIFSGLMGGMLFVFPLLPLLLPICILRLVQINQLLRPEGGIREAVRQIQELPAKERKLLLKESKEACTVHRLLGSRSILLLVAVICSISLLVVSGFFYVNLSG